MLHLKFYFQLGVYISDEWYTDAFLKGTYKWYYASNCIWDIVYSYIIVYEFTYMIKPNFTTIKISIKVYMI